jgi:hypothetical protein
MAVAYLDESGDLGFDFSKKKTSRYFVVAILLCQDPKPVSKVVKSIFSGFNKTEIRNHHGVLHAFKERPETRRRLLRGLSDSNVSILIIRLDKYQVYSQLPDESHVLYNYVANVLFDRLITKELVPLNEPIQLIASRRETNRFLNEGFRSDIQNSIRERHGIEVEIEIKAPSQAKGLQAVDCLAWSFFRKYEHSDDSYAELVAAKIVEESSLYGGTEKQNL